MNESDTRAKLIDPALAAAGWGPERITREKHIAPGQVTPDPHTRRPLIADYLLLDGKRPVAVVEAKADGKDYDEGEPQARTYAEKLGLRFGFSTNGHKILQIDLATGKSKTLAMDAFPSPAAVLAVLGPVPAAERTALFAACAAIPWDRADGRSMRYYQELAANAALAAIGEGRRRILLTLATGTGKTFIAFQIVHKLVEARWSARPLGSRPPRVLFLTDRNFLANQASQDFSLPQNAGCRLNAQLRNLPQDRQVYFTLYQTLLGGAGYDAVGETDEGGDTERFRLQKFARDFFDLVIVDECHRGGANDESEWRQVLDYFKGAVHLGLTATPRCDQNGSTYAYFGKPVYTYSLKAGIADGFLSPFVVERCYSTIGAYTYEPGDEISDPAAVERGRVYENDALEREDILIPARDRHFIQELFKVMPLDRKAIVFCEDQNHALRMARAIREAAWARGIKDRHFCERVTANDGARGEALIKVFSKTDETSPMILTTSQKLSTGLDAKDVRGIVFLRNVKSMIEFKQIIGRGTRILDGKPYFTIYDFTGVTEKFKDPAWDGPVVCPRCGQNPCVCPKGGGEPPPGPHRPCPVCGQWPCICAKPAKAGATIKLASGRQVHATWEMSVWFDGQPVGLEQLVVRLTACVKESAKDRGDLVRLWADFDKREDLLKHFAESGFAKDVLTEIQSKVDLVQADLLDVLLEVAYGAQPYLERRDRAKLALGASVGQPQPAKEAIYDLVEAYVRDGVWVLGRNSMLDFLKNRYGSLTQAAKKLGQPDVASLLSVFGQVQKRLYPVARRA